MSVFIQRVTALIIGLCTVSRGEACPVKGVKTVMMDHRHAQTSFLGFSYNKVTLKEFIIIFLQILIKCLIIVGIMDDIR